MISPAPIAVTLFLKDESAWQDELSPLFARPDCQVNLVKSVAEAWAILETQKVDVVVASADYDDSFSLFSTIHATLPALNRPLLVLIYSQPPTQAHLADLVLPIPHLRHLDEELKTFLDLRAANNSLIQANRLLLEDNHRLKNVLEAHHRSNGDVNLLKNVIVRNVSHELKTPLLQVKSAIALMTETPGENEKLLQYATDATARLEAVVRNITLLNELLNESLEVHSMGPVLVKELVEYALRNLRRSWEHKDQIDRIKFYIAPDTPPVFGDKQGLGIALQLLVDNGLKFSQQAVEISADKAENQVRIAVRDYGIGIANDKLGRIFDSFYQIDGSSTRRYGGMGIGLAIVRVILERHKSQVKVESEIGRGSTFSFTLSTAEIHV